MVLGLDVDLFGLLWCCFDEILILFVMGFDGSGWSTVLFMIIVGVFEVEFGIELYFFALCKSFLVDVFGWME